MYKNFTVQVLIFHSPPSSSRPVGWHSTQFQVAHAFFQVLALHLGRVVFVAAIAGVGDIVGGVAYLAFDLKAASMLA